MKKNLRIVSAAAAALLAVAPIAVSGVASAAVTVNNATATQPTQATAGTVTVNISLDATADKTTVADAIKSAKVTVNGATLNGAVNASNISILDSKGNALKSDATLASSTAYQVEIKGLKLKGLTTGNTYTIAGGTVSGKSTQTAEELNATNGVDFTSDSFYVFNKSLTGNPYVVNSKNTVVSNGEIPLGDNTSIDKLAAAITKEYSVANKTTGTAEGMNFSDTAVKDAIKAALKDANITTDKDGNFTAPANNFTVKLTAYASNGKTVEFPVTVTSHNTVASNAPEITTTKAAYKETSKDSNVYNLQLNQNDAVNANSIAGDFSATISKDNKTNLSVKVDSSNLNTAVVGKYTVVLSATNPQGKTTKATINVTVGNPGDTKTVQAGSETAKVVTIDGNKVTDTNNTLANDAKVATFGTVTVNGVSYTRINSANSNEFVETKYVDGSIKEETTKSAKIMYKSAIYTLGNDNKMSNSGKTIAGYTDTDLVTSNGNLKVYTINGETFYKLAKNQGYVRARNVTGSKMTLKKNSYVYKSNGKRASKKLLKKGSTITVYGGQYKAIKKYGKKAVRVGVNRYVKVVNVKYELTK